MKRRNHEIYEKTDHCEYGLTAPRKGAKWSGGRNPIPARGDRVMVKVNGFGIGTVRGYFVEWGYLGVYVECDEYPKWWIDQNAEDPLCCILVFGAEIEPVKHEENAQSHS